MAGFEFSVAVGDSYEDAIIRRMLYGLQLRGRQRAVGVRYRRVDGGYVVNVDGPLTNIQASLDPVAIALGAMADVIDAPMPRARRLRVGHRILRGYVGGAWEATVNVLDISAELGATPHSFYFASVGDPIIQYRLDGLARLLASWTNRDATTEQVLEELHSVTESAMGVLLGPQWDDRSYAEQANELSARDLINSDDRDALIELKDRRKDVRHHLGSMSRDELINHLPGVLAAIHTIVGRFAD